jgi:DNA mismatch endonuclease (patch repair protein)
MSSQSRKDTAPELAIRRELHRAGLRYFVHRRPLPHLRREADIVFPSVKVAVFVDGCFWHGCPQHGQRRHAKNSWYWPQKLDQNRLRDQDTDGRLEAQGWVSLRIWEHEEPEAAVERIREAVSSRNKAAI